MSDREDRRYAKETLKKQKGLKAVKYLLRQNTNAHTIVYTNIKGY
jgi:hypothetical protein